MLKMKPLHYLRNQLDLFCPHKKSWSVTGTLPRRFMVRDVSLQVHCQNVSLISKSYEPSLDNGPSSFAEEAVEFLSLNTNVTTPVFRQ